MFSQTAQLNAQVFFTPSVTTKMEPIDDVRLIVQYETKMITDTLHPEKIVEESLMLKIGNVSSSFSSYTRFVSDSIHNDNIKKNNGVFTMNSMSLGFSGIVTYHIYKNYPEGKVTTLDKIGISLFRCEEENEVPAWELLTDTMTILTYSCQKAICCFKGRNYEAWFTPEIPRSEGPWKLHGLPGLILRAADSQGHYTFECTGLINGNEKLLFGADGYESVSRKNLNTLYERYATDPEGFITSTMPNVTTFTVSNGEVVENKKSAKKNPYNPIERTD